MADQKLTEKTELTTPVGDDLIHVVDISDTTSDPAGTSKKMKISNLPSSGGSGTLQEVTDAGKVTTNDVTVKNIKINDATLNAEYEVIERGVALGFPVATLRPTAATEQIAFDIMPNGTPSSFGVNGVAWFDVVDTDLKGVTGVAASSIRLGIDKNSNKAHFGVLNYDGATATRLSIVMDTVANEVGGIETDGELTWKGDISISAVSPTFRIYEAGGGGYGNITSFSTTEPYDGGTFQGAVRLVNETGNLILQAAIAGKDVVVISGGGLMSSFEVLRASASGLVTAKKNTIALINTNVKALITKEYADATYVGGGSSSSTGTVLSLVNVNGILYNMSSANTATTYTTSGTTLNAYARILINAASEPVVTGGTKIAGSTFAVSTNMYLTVWYNGNRVEFWFEEI